MIEGIFIGIGIATLSIFVLWIFYNVGFNRGRQYEINEFEKLGPQMFKNRFPQWTKTEYFPNKKEE